MRHEVGVGHAMQNTFTLNTENHRNEEQTLIIRTSAVYVMFASRSGRRTNSRNGGVRPRASRSMRKDALSVRNERAHDFGLDFHRHEIIC